MAQAVLSGGTKPKLMRKLYISILSALMMVSCGSHHTDPSPTGGTQGGDTRPGSNFDFTYSMGVNLNEQAGQADLNDLADTKTKYVRSFVEMIDLYKNNTIDTDPNLNTFITFHSKGYKTVLNLKFNFIANAFPAVNSTDWNNYIAFIDKILDKAMPYTDVLIVGNEPFIEADPSTWNEPLNSFYKSACARVYSYFQLHGIDKPIFLGSFDNMYQSSRTGNTGVLNLLSFVKNTAYLSGADVHIHHNTDAEMTSALSFMDNHLRDDQKMIVSEFSAKNYFKAYNTNLIDPAFIAAANASTTDNIYPPPAGVTQNYQYIDYALKNPRPVEEWYAFWHYSAYLENNKNYLCSANTDFKSYHKVFLACYALRQSYPVNTDFTATTDPWVLNAMFLNRSVQQVNGRNARSYSFLDQFLKIQANQDPCQ